MTPDWDGARQALDLMRPVLEYLQHQHRLNGMDILGWGIVTADPPMVYVKTPPGFNVPDIIAGVMILHEVVN